ncbi:PEP-CTERM sorting domain-containing protein [Roseateles toxinivorans]|uniref:Putative secreted protein with PEP-CTERM sorting signal n=1 Tax=Roseateles toxinivorans TaxID=270368 RepID=A0A4R6QT35_9BURK|nr:PEP-CTERM sorting domain-containing protein [Roseateles toxinivorans]TDP74511.1 putative secreted protein with PEP-CTERM sorting signal [Roseateles toxinivorans]
MLLRATALLTFAAAAGVLPVQAANLIVNPGNEEAMVAGEIPGWVEVIGTGWTQRSLDPVAFEGAHYFFAGAGSTATLRQFIDVSSFATSIDGGLATVAFSGRVRSWPQTPVDTSSITISFLDAVGTVLGSHTIGPYSDTTQWQLVSADMAAPTSMRAVQLDLIATRFGGTNNDGYFDDLSLEVMAVPEPSSAALLAAGVTALLWRRRIRRQGI